MVNFTISEVLFLNQEIKIIYINSIDLILDKIKEEKITQNVFNDLILEQIIEIGIIKSSKDIERNVDYEDCKNQIAHPMDLIEENYKVKVHMFNIGEVVQKVNICNIYVDKIVVVNYNDVHILDVEI